MNRCAVVQGGLIGGDDHLAVCTGGTAEHVAVALAHLGVLHGQQGPAQRADQSGHRRPGLRGGSDGDHAGGDVVVETEEVGAAPLPAGDPVDAEERHGPGETGLVQ